ncbi:hypothetical protein VTN96DRAFT_6324 [Rasamsonia emersonii]
MDPALNGPPSFTEDSSRRNGTLARALPLQRNKREYVFWPQPSGMEEEMHAHVSRGGCPRGRARISAAVCFVPWSQMIRKEQRGDTIAWKQSSTDVTCTRHRPMGAPRRQSRPGQGGLPDARELSQFANAQWRFWKTAGSWCLELCGLAGLPSNSDRRRQCSYFPVGRC